jgi:phage gp36-like protein
MYATAQQFLNRFDSTRLAQLAAPGDSEVDGILFALTIANGDRSAYDADVIAKADAALVRLNSSIESADRIINSYIKQHWPLPLDQALIDTSPLPTCCMDLTVYDLSGTTTTEDEERRRNEAIALLRDISTGKASLGEQQGTAVASQNSYIVKNGCSKEIDYSEYS